MKPAKQTLITGCYRSGTEYITLLLNNQPDLAATMYTVSFMRFCYNRYNPIDNEMNYSKLLHDAAKRIKERYNRTLHVKRIIEYCKSIDHVSYALLYDLMMKDLFLFDSAKRYWAEKTQLVWTKIPDFLDMFPEGKVIHVHRDPRSVLASFKNFTYAPPPAYLGAIFNCFGSMKLGLEYNKNYSRYKAVRYEDILLKPEETLVDLFEFLGLSSDHDLVSEEGWVDAYGKPWGHNSAFLNSPEKKQRFDKTAALSRWKKHLEDWEVSLCECICEEVMDNYQYALSEVDVPWKDVIKPVMKDDTLTDFFRRWIVKNEGIEQFPTDPLEKKNWTENVVVENV